jgi:hypothetical protein
LLHSLDSLDGSPAKIIKSHHIAAEGGQWVVRLDEPAPGAAVVVAVDVDGEIGEDTETVTTPITVKEP